MQLESLFGFQVDRWYEQIQDAEKAEQYIQRILANVEDDIADLEGAINTAIRRRESAERVILSVESDHIVVENPNRYLEDVRRATMRNRAFIRDMTYSELQNTGDMALIPVDIREELYTYYSSIGSFAQFEATVAANQVEAYKRFAGILAPEHFDLVIAPSGVDRAALDFTSEEALAAAERLRSNKPALDWLGRVRDSHIQEERSSLRFLSAAQVLKGKLEEHLR